METDQKILERLPWNNIQTSGQFFFFLALDGVCELWSKNFKKERNKTWFAFITEDSTRINQYLNKIWIIGLLKYYYVQI